tara:strand:+ start:212 stop:1282 length:1071 start_codon:yes stop_codon:yes gene_type:complete
MSKAAQLAALIGSGQAQGNRNIVINGACVIDQRNNGSSFTPADTNYTVDRWRYTASQASKFTFQQNAAAVTPPVGFTNYMGFTVASAVSIGNGDYFAITQRIEGYTTDQLEFGTSNAKNVTLSFWVRSSLTGTFGGALRGASFGRAFPFTYAISSANTWEYKTVAVDGDTSGTYQSGNTTGLEVIFGLGVGSTNSGSAGAWTASGHFSATGAVSVVGTGSATWYVTGIQLEIGDVATPFEHEDFGTTLAKCQRYFVNNNGHGGSTGGINMARSVYANAADGVTNFPVEMRANPTITFFDAASTAGTLTENGSANGRASTALYVSRTTVSRATSSAFATAAGAGYHVQGTYKADAEL